jgi:serine/threonine-protein kinase RsbW
MAAIKFPAKFESLDEIRDYVGKKARAEKFTDRAVYSIQLATDEAASNIIEHAYVGYTNASIELTCVFKKDRLIITLLDHGKSFDISKVETPDITTDLSNRKIGGLGIYLMRKLMDEVHYEVTKNGNVLTLIKLKD